MICLVDTSVVLKWFHEEGESDVEPARRLLAAHRSRNARVLLLDLVAYELGNVLVRALRRPATVVTQQLDLLHRLCGPLVHPAPSWHAGAAQLAQRDRLTFYDASWAAAAEALECDLVSADRQLLAVGAITASEAVARL